MAEIETSLEIETPVFKKFKEFLVAKSIYSPNVFSKTPQSLSTFPTVILKETNNRDYSQGVTLDRTEFVNEITDTIEIYTKDMIIDGNKVSSKKIMQELKELTYVFFREWGFTRTQSTEADYLNYEVDRYIIIETCTLNSWNRKINL